MQVLAVEPVIHTTVMCCQHLSPRRWFRIHRMLGKRMLLSINLVTSHLTVAHRLFPI